MSAKSRHVAGKYGKTFRKIAEELFGKAIPAVAGIPAAKLAKAESRLGIHFPSALRQYYLELGAFDKLNSAHNRIVRPNDWEILDRRLLFCEENQCVCVWGIETGATASDPAVFQGVKNGVWKWYRSDLDMFDFLQLTIYLQAAWGGLEHYYFHWEAKKAIRAIRDSWEQVVDNQGLRIWKHDGILLSHLRGNNFCLFAGQDEPTLERLMEQFARKGHDCQQ